VTQTLLQAARTGDERAFGELTDPYRRELQLHCYRMLGSVQDAEDALQDTLVAAWRGLEGFEERASVRAWLYRIATNRCLNLLREAGRRPQRAAGATLPFSPPPATRMSEVSWLEPCPEDWLEALPDAAPGPEALYEAREGVGLAFITALQRLTPAQRAVLVLRDVLGFRASEVAETLETTEASVNSALQRARATLDARALPGRDRAAALESPEQRQLVASFADAFEQGDIDRVVAMLTEDAWVTMPPEPYEYQGLDAITDFLRHTSFTARAERQAKLVPARANGQPAFAHYMRLAGEPVGRLSGLLVLELDGERIAAITRFALSNLPPQFAFPDTLDW
jgi:RNA polymerase sigma-70 factor (ECF subfamily)